MRLFSCEALIRRQGSKQCRCLLMRLYIRNSLFLFPPSSSVPTPASSPINPEAIRDRKYRKLRQNCDIQLPPLGGSPTATTRVATGTPMARSNERNQTGRSSPLHSKVGPDELVHSDPITLSNAAGQQFLAFILAGRGGLGLQPWFRPFCDSQAARTDS